MGLVKITPGEFVNYHHELNVAIRNWQDEAIREKDTDETTDKGEVRTWSDPRHFYRTCAFSTLGSWDLAHFTLTYDQGIATSLPYIGHAIGQQLYFLHDISLEFPVEMVAEHSRHTGGSDENFLTLLEKIGVTYCFKHKAQHTTLRAGQKRLIARGDTNYGVVAQKFDLVSIYNGYIFGYDYPGQCGEPLSGDSTVWNRSEQANVEEKLFTKEQREKIHPDNPIGIFQLNKNPNFKLECTQEHRILIYLFLLYKIGKHWGDDDDITFAKPFFTDNFFDLAIIFRGTNFGKMKAIASAAGKITQEDVNDFYELTRYGESGLFSKEYATLKLVNFKPLYHLSYNIEGFSYPQIAHIQKRIESSFLNHGDCKINICKRLPHYTCPHETLSSCVGRVLKEEWQHPDHEGIPAGEMRLMPSILLATQTSLSDHIFNLLCVWRDNCGAVMAWECRPAINEVHGRYSFEIRFMKEEITLKQFIVSFAFLTMFLSKECARKISLLKKLPIEARKIHNPFLQIKTKLQYGEDSCGQKDMAPLPFSAISSSPYYGNICLTNRVKMIQICYDSLHALDERVKSEKAVGGAWPGRLFHPNSPIFKRINGKDEKQSAQEDVVAKITGNLLASLMALEGISPAAPFQGEFNRFLKKKFSGFVTPDTLELFFSTLCAIDSFLSNQISYYLYLDVRVFSIEFLSLLFSVCPCEVGGRHYVLYWDERSKTIVHCAEDADSIMQGLERAIIQFITTVEKVSSQKLSGAYPQHDRNFSRLSDIRVFQNKKIQAISWLINSLIREFVDDFRQNVRPDTRDKLPRHLPLFGNSPEMILLRGKLTVEINVRNLASIEGISLVTHEVGHILCDYLKRQRPKGDANKLKFWNPGWCSSGIECNVRPSGSNDIEIPDIEDYGPNWHHYFFHPIPVIDEVFADLYSFYVTFAPLKKFYGPDFEHLCPNVDHRTLVHERTDQYASLNEDETGKYDRIDDFTLSFIAQIVRFPQIVNRHGLYHLFIRLAVMLGIAKFANNRELLLKGTGIRTEAELNGKPEIVSRVAGTICHHFIQPFFKNKLIILLTKLRAREKDPNMQPLILEKALDVLLVLADEDKKTSKGATSEQHTDTDEELYYFFNNDIKGIFAAYFKMYIRGVALSDPTFLYIRKYAAAENASSMGTVYREPNDAYLVRQGINPTDTGKLTSLQCFYQSLQLCGTINLRFSVVSYDKHLVIDGYQGFRSHAAQQYLSRTRRLATTVLWHGALQAINEEVQKMNAEHHEWWDDKADSDVKVMALDKQQAVQQRIARGQA